jgi:hypothetical protein
VDACPACRRPQTPRTNVLIARNLVSIPRHRPDQAPRDPSATNPVNKVGSRTPRPVSRSPRRRMQRDNLDAAIRFSSCLSRCSPCPHCRHSYLKNAARFTDDWSGEAAPQHSASSKRRLWADSSQHPGDCLMRQVDLLDLAREKAFLPSMTDLSSQSLEDLTIDEAARPEAPKVPAATDMHRRQGRQLAAIHRHYLMEIAQIGAVASARCSSFTTTLKAPICSPGSRRLAEACSERS